MKNILIKNGSILTDQGWIKPGYLWITGNKICEIEQGDPSEKLNSQADEIIDAQHCAVLPGLTNAHTHLSQTFMRGLAGGRPLIDWLKEVIWPIQGVISPEEMYLAALLGLVENLHCGAIWVTDHHKITATSTHTDAVVKAAREVGLNFTLARSWSDRGKHPENINLILADLEGIHERTAADKCITIANGPLALWRCSQEALITTHNWALAHETITHLHVSESQNEVQMSLNEYGCRPVEWLVSIGVLDADIQLVHAVWVDADEMALIAKSRSQVVHCPVSNAVLGSGVAPIPQMLDQDIHIQLGTDGPASNDTQDVWETLKAAVSFGRAITQNSTVLPPSQALKLATGGKTLQIGAFADLILVDLNHPRAVPVQDPSSTLVFGTHGSDVKSVMIQGEFLMQNGRITILDEYALYDECRQAIQSLRKRAGIIV